jgi:hypothetical protein
MLPPQQPSAMRERRYVPHCVAQEARRRPPEPMNGHGARPQRTMPPTQRQIPRALQDSPHVVFFCSSSTTTTTTTAAAARAACAPPRV